MQSVCGCDTLSGGVEWDEMDLAKSYINNCDQVAEDYLNYNVLSTSTGLQNVTNDAYHDQCFFDKTCSINAVCCLQCFNPIRGPSFA